jgi:hypothetical protein
VCRRGQVTDGQRAVRFSAGDAFARLAGAVFAGEGHQLPGGVRNRDSHRWKIDVVGMGQRPHHEVCAVSRVTPLAGSRDILASKRKGLFLFVLRVHTETR